MRSNSLATNAKRSGQAGAFALSMVIMLLLADLTIARNPAGSLDPAFGDGGKLLVESPPFSMLAGIAIEPDGKLIVAGGDITHVLLARFNRDGSPDEGFGLNGAVTLDPGGNFYPGALALQPDGKIIVAGTRRRGYESLDFFLARLNPDGSLDESFGANGFATADFDGGADSVSAIALLPRGKIAVAGATMGNTARVSFALARFLSDGRLDTSFGDQGRVATPIGYDSMAEAMLVEPGGKIIVGGRAITGQTTLVDSALARYDKRGCLDPSFGSSGIVTTDWETQDGISELAWAPHGKIVAAGGGRTLLARYNNDGSLDTGFGSNGSVQLIPAPITYATAMAVQPGGEILVLGTYNYGDSPDFAIIRFNPDGSLDDQFGTNGMAVVGFGRRQDYPYFLAARPNGGIVVAGLSHEYVNGVYMRTDLALAGLRGK